MCLPNPTPLPATVEIDRDFTYPSSNWMSAFAFDQIEGRLADGKPRPTWVIKIGVDYISVYFDEARFIAVGVLHVGGFRSRGTQSLGIAVEKLRARGYVVQSQLDAAIAAK